MYHLFPTFSKQADKTELGRAVRRIGVEHRFFSGEVPFVYRNRRELALRCIPKLLWYSIRTSFASMLLSHPRPTAALVGSDIHVLIFAGLRWIFHRRTCIVLTSFIYTSRQSRWQNALRQKIFRFMLTRADLVIVHSRLEANTYPKRFNLPASRFAFVPWGTTVDMRAELMEDLSRFDPPPSASYIVSAGKSGRDYATLFRAVAGLSTELRVVCDYPPALQTAPRPERVTVLDNCHGSDYILALFWADVVVIPLAVEDISAGQMVLVQAMALGKAIIVTRNHAISDYVVDGEDAIIVERSDVAGMRAAIQSLLSDPALRTQLGRNAMAKYEQFLTTEAHMRAIFAAVAVYCEGV